MNSEGVFSGRLPTFQIRRILKIEMPENLSNGWKVYSINKPISLIGFNYTTLKLI